MTEEFTVKCGLQLTNGNLKFSGVPTSFQADQTTRNGPIPGSILATTGGVTIALTALTTPGLTHLVNTEPAGGNYVQVGLYISSTFYPVLDLLPGEAFALRLARDILTANTGAAVVRVKANTASVVMGFYSFDK